MSNSHYERWLWKAPIGLLFIAGGIFFMYYSLAILEIKERWIVYGVISAAATALGAYLLCSAFIHKMKSDLIKRQKARSGGVKSNQEEPNL